jgi:ribosomal protein S18 acetylase RimI-like enzyme
MTIIRRSIFWKLLFAFPCSVSSLLQSSTSSHLPSSSAPITPKNLNGVQLTTINGSSKTAVKSNVNTNNISIRSTISEDIPTIVDLLAFETSPPPSQSVFNWNAKMQRLKTVQSLSTQLTTRLHAIDAGKAILRSSIMDEYESMTDSAEEFASLTPQILWNDESFRNKCERAVKTAMEFEKYSTPWNHHNFALTPDPRMLNHFMITATDTSFMDEPVGFCEVGMLSHPDEMIEDDEGDESVEQERESIIFCIGNLVVSPNQRRKGVGQKLMKSALRAIRMYSKRTSSTATAGLYVDEMNVGATQLYENMGFRVTGKCNYVEGRVFMQANLMDRDMYSNKNVEEASEVVESSSSTALS